MATSAAPDPKSPPPAVGASVIAAADPTQPRRLSEELALILREFEVEQVTLREVIGLMHGRGYLLFVMLISLPFCTPIPLPGLSTPLGLVIGIIGVRLALGQKPWLPARLLDLRLPPAVFKKVFAVTQRIILWFERLLRPRLLWLTATPMLRQLHAIPIVICAALLLLPLPIPFSNTVPAWSIMLISGGLLERDGGFILAGHVAALFAIAFFTVIGVFGTEAVSWLWKWAQ
ncbi:MAG: exopolysaccharide biosynthesis protein [Opitutaceae bacterium]|nr:exopolysaccharide biosynthesis protein [Opitutaceae bacterium]